MKETINELRILVSSNKTEIAISKLQNIFTLADTPDKNTVVMLSARKENLDSEYAMGIISHENKNLENNKINHGLLMLIEKLEKDPSIFQRFQAVEASIQNDQLQKTNLLLSDDVKDALFRRMSIIKNKKLNVKALWIDDNPPLPDDLDLFSSIGINFETASSSAMALEKIKEQTFDFLISDIAREDNPTEGLDHHKKLHQLGHNIPTIFYVGNHHPELGTPPYVFGITNLLSELVHYVMDILERKY